MNSIRFAAMLVAFLITSWVNSAPRVLFSHYAPDEQLLNLQVNDETLVANLNFGDSDSRYRLVEPGLSTFNVVDEDGEILASRSFALVRSDFSLIAYNSANGEVQLELLTDFVVDRADSVIQNTVIRAGTFAKLSSNFQFGFERLTTVALNGEPTMFGSESFTQIGNGIQVLSPELLRSGADGNGGDFESDLLVRIGTLAGTSDNFQQLIFTADSTLPSGTTDLFVIGNGQIHPYQLIQRRRPGNRSASESGLYGEPGIVGSGVQVAELGDDGRVYGLLYTYDELGEPLWFYFDSICDGLPDDPEYRQLACSDPSVAPVSDSVYSVSFYRAAGGVMQPGMGATIEPVGFGRLNLRTLLDGENQQFSTATMRVRLADLAEILATGASIPPGVRFVFQQLPEN
ncbi:MAG: hypothetical protein AB8B96_14670 [Lysobacterales bacterium]